MLLSLCFSAACAVLPCRQTVTTTVHQDPRSAPGVREVTNAVYDVGDLLERASPLGESPAANGASIEWSSAPNQLELSRLLRVFSEPPFEAGDRIDCLVNGAIAGPLVVTAGAEQQAFARSFLDLQREREDKTSIAFHLVTGAKDSFAALGIPQSGLFGDRAEVESLLVQFTHGSFDVLSSPTVVTRVLQRADVSVLSQFSYVKEFHTQIVQPSGQLIADPIVEVINEGIICRARSVALPDGDFGLTIDVENVEILRPVRTKTVRIAAGVDAEGEIQLPEVLRARLSGDVRLAAGATAVFVTPLKEDEDLALFVSIELARPGGR